LEAKIKSAKTHISEITDAAEDTWENIKNKFDNLTDDIGSSFKKFFDKDEQDNLSKNAESDEQK
jgi:hypothetical protein